MSVPPTVPAPRNPMPMVESMWSPTIDGPPSRPAQAHRPAGRYLPREEGDDTRSTTEEHAGDPGGVATPADAADSWGRVRARLVAATILLVPTVTKPFVLGPFRWVTLAAVALTAILFLLAAPLVARRLRDDPVNAAAGTMVVLAAATLLAFAVHPSGTGAALAAYAVAGTGIVAVVAGMDAVERRRFVAAPLLATAALQGLLALLQGVTGRPWVLSWVAPGLTLREIDGFLRPQGTMTHVYEVAALGLLAAGVWAATVRERPGPWSRLGLALAGVAVGATHSRAALLGLVLLLGALLWGRRRGDRDAGRVALWIGAGFAVAALVTFPHWMARYEHTATADLDAASLGRVTLTREAAHLVAEHPLLGVGPGRFVTVLRDEGVLDERYPFPAHDVPLTLAAESGILAAVAVTLLLATTGLQAVRAGPGPAALYLGTLPFLLFDVLHYDRPTGLVLLAVWLGILAAATRRDHPRSRRSRSS